MPVFRGFLVAVGFLTRFGPAGVWRGEDVAAAVAWFPVVGLVLGAVLAGPVALGLFAGEPWIAAWLVVLGDLAATRGLHADGVADVADAWGSMARGERFFEILKDSRVGAFGVMGLFVVLAGKLILFSALFARGQAGGVAFCFVAGRACAVWLMGLGGHLARPGLGALFAPGAGARTRAVVLAVTVILGAFLAPLRGVAAGCLLGAGVVAMLYGLARDRGGLNGDFLGAAVVGGEIAACLGMFV
ncbi:adenosylcobinamide-GDP ribazoletransferase [Desulfolutivibrio sulfoxidireducens]|uniref:adenosylcobinamide-GDP ribazoletransferase n=1 Tax=Desulfolutivibrio sulfoxidireducens TaxID=2773299 RepID=UPI00159E2898|nr:adenosylcobinamide-GDP ribazoletransferase [Desulfolutivibrio sulfoxidireducens]QLA14732.1 adenosylcobinamide-GDP ribazoletransferase [Desulfolutivibrio sulfoxidireducens]QLA18313.1 adenosylcobinamide-GDP ribazoletransferase [Desulfolutivibrio sulfoxidireducens]